MYRIVCVTSLGSGRNGRVDVVICERGRYPRDMLGPGCGNLHAHVTFAYTMYEACSKGLGEEERSMVSDPT